MFDNSIAHRRIMKKKKLNDMIAQAKEEGKDWKVNQLESKLFMFNRKNYPTIVWDSSKGTYHNPARAAKKLKQREA